MKKKENVKEEIKHELIGMILIALSFFIVLCFWQGTGGNDISTIGAVGSFFYRVMTTFFGSGRYLIPLVLFILGITRLWTRKKWSKQVITSWFVIVLSILAILHLQLPESQQNLAAGMEGEGGGIAGALAARLSLTLFGNVGAYIFLIVCIGISIVVIAQKPFIVLLRNLYNQVCDFLGKTRQELVDFIFQKEEAKAVKKKKSNRQIKIEYEEDVHETPLIVDHTETVVEEKEINAMSSPAVVRGHLRLVEKKDNENEKQKEDAIEETLSTDYVKPSLSLLQFPTYAKSRRLNKNITDNVKILEETLVNFGVKAKVTQVSKGPSITRYEIQPPPGVKVSRIVNLADDIALSLAAPQVRIEAPIPGKAAVGIEVPNEEIAVVTLREVLENDIFQNSPSNLSIALGKDIGGNPIVADLSKMPHLLIAGATGSGKSVCMNAIIASILFKASPDEVKLLMIDPKVVELSNFNGIPHLISPVVTDPKKAASSLRWAVHEMETRYELFAGLGVKDIIRYNQARKAEEQPEFPTLPYIVILIDELADLMMVAPADVEDAICRLAQMARAAGIHLVVATQRPSVDVITGIIKANIPSRIAFAVSSQTDSRTILDMGGAERLLGRGDMLFYPTGMAKPIRVQGVYISDQEMDKLVTHLKNQITPRYITPWENEESNAREETEEDELLPQAAKLFIESGQASISLLQRRLRIGYTRAARIIDQLEDRGIVGAYEGSKPRSIRMNWEEYERVFVENK